MRYSVQPGDRIYIYIQPGDRGYRFLLFAKNIGQNIGENTSKNVSGKYNQKLLDQANKSATDALKTSSKRVI